MIAPAATAGGEPVSTKQLTLRVADITTRLVCDDSALRLTVSDTSSRFLVHPGNTDEPDATTRVQRAPQLSEPSGDMLFDSGGTWRMYRERDDFVFSFVSTALGTAPYRLARFDTSFTRGTISFNGACIPDSAALAPLEYPLDELMMINLLARGRGVEVHGCGVVDPDGRAYLFAGPSEAGKSTSARLWHHEGATVLSDDRVVLRLSEGRVWMYGTPWHGEEEFACPASAPLTRICFLAHGPGNSLRPASGAGAAARLFTCCFPPFHDHAGLDFTLGLLGRIVDRVPCFELTFVPDASVVGFVRGRA
jgi:hypothetical protein